MTDSQDMVRGTMAEEIPRSSTQAKETHVRKQTGSPEQTSNEYATSQ